MKSNIVKILVVDDEYYNFRLISEILDGYNVMVIHANCGSEAIEKCIVHTDFSLILMDIKMKGMNGFEVAAQLSGIMKKIPIVFQSAYSKDFVNDEIMKSFGNGFLSKPIKKDILIAEIKKYVNINLDNDIIVKSKLLYKLKFFQNIINFFL